MCIGSQHVAIPNPIRRRALPQVDNHIEHGAGGHPNQFSLRRISRLIVQPAQDMLRRSAVVVLQEIKIEPDLAKSLAVPRFEEKAAGISGDLRLQQPRIVDLSREFFYAKAWSVEPGARSGESESEQG